MVGPSVCPEDGVTRYYADRTQGPACAIACPAATVFRNYHVHGRGQAGGAEAQLDLARDAGAAVGNGEAGMLTLTLTRTLTLTPTPTTTTNDGEAGYWRMQNGYLLPARRGGLAKLAERLRGEVRVRPTSP